MNKIRQFTFSTLKTCVTTCDQKCKQIPYEFGVYSTWLLRKDVCGVRVKMTHITHNG